MTLAQHHPGTLPTRRQALVLAAAASVAATHRHAAAAGPLSVPAFAAAPPGSGIASGWQHQGLPKVDRRNSFDIVADASRQVLRVRSSSSASSLLARPGGEARPRTGLQ
ncbi:MAG: hypothetical protein V4669_01410 [Pseudomonadota bacterium]